MQESFLEFEDNSNLWFQLYFHVLVHHDHLTRTNTIDSGLKSKSVNINRVWVLSKTKQKEVEGAILVISTPSLKLDIGNFRGKVVCFVNFLWGVVSP